MAKAEENDIGTIVTLLIVAAAFAFFVYMTSGYGGALSIPMYM